MAGKGSVFSSFLVFALACCSYATCQEDIKARVQDLETQVRELAQEVIQLRGALRAQEKLSEQLARQSKPVRQELLYDDIIASFLEEKPEHGLYLFYRQLIHSHLWLGGYLELQIEGRETVPEQSILNLSRLGLSWRASLSEAFSIHGDIFLHEDEKVQIAHSYLLISGDPLLSAKAGVIRVPWGKFNTNYSPPSQELGSIPGVVQWIMPTVWAEPGVSLFGQYSGIPGISCNYEALFSTGFGESGFNVTSGNRAGRQGISRDNNADIMVSGRLELMPRLSLEVISLAIGISGIIGQYDARERNEMRGGAVDYFLRIGPFSLIGDQDRLIVLGEYVQLHLERDDWTKTHLPGIVPRMEGYYVELQYRFFIEAWRNANIFFSDHSYFTLAFRYEQTDLDLSRQGASTLDDQEIYTLGMSFHPIEQTLMRVEYNWIHEWFLGKRAWNNRVLVSLATYF